MYKLVSLQIIHTRPAQIIMYNINTVLVNLNEAFGESF